ncbi:cupin domain-containing protein [Streptomyces botrytidirepellens]|uniref:cupin domain-containing protein n=1 Tax=Streptomyces botrytidirepellens TaxID=2486417 RepID=UPI0026A69142
MSLITSGGRSAVFLRETEAETLSGAANTTRLLADSSTTSGALSSQRVTLRQGADGAVPHHHNNSAELFFVLSGRLQALAGDEVITADEGDFLVVPPACRTPSRPNRVRTPMC